MSYKLRNYQKEAISAIMNNTNGIVHMATGCHTKGTKILMYDGNLKNVEDINIGDLIMGDDSTPRKILQLHRGIDDMYKVTPVKGESFVVNKGHILSLKTTNLGNGVNKYEQKYNEKKSGGIINVSVAEYLNKSNTFKHINKLYRVPIIFEEKKLPIDPYLVGLLLGDGCICNHIVNICTMDDEVVSEIYKYGEKYNLRIRVEDKPNKSKFYYFVKHDGKKDSHSNHYLSYNLKKLNLYGTKCATKFIPNIYKTSSKQQRLEILAGLIDTDGYLHHNGYEYVTKSTFLKDDVLFLVRSLGLAGYSSEKIIKGETYYRINISGDCSIVPVRINRKKAQSRSQKKDVLKTGFNVEYVGKDDYYGFAVDKNNLYVMGDFTVTHNSGKGVIIADVASKIEGRTLIVVPNKELRTQLIDKLKIIDENLDIGSVQANLNEVSNKIVVATRQTLTYKDSNRMNDMLKYGDFEIVFYDEAHEATNQALKIKKVINNNAKFIGTTATPYNKELVKVFDKIIYQKRLYDLIKEQYLCEPKAIYVHTDVDLSNVKTVGGEFIQKHLEEAVDTLERNELIIESYEKHCKDRKSTIIFATGIEHSRNIAQAFRDKGYNCKSIDSQMDNTKERDNIIGEFMSGKLPIIVNVGMLTRGFDYSEVDALILARPTKSRMLYEQILGRGLRISDNKKDCLIIDVVDVMNKHDVMRLPDVFNVDIKDGETLTEAEERIQQEAEDEKLRIQEEFRRKEEERQKLIEEQFELFKTNMGLYFREDAYCDWYKITNEVYALSYDSFNHFVIKNIDETFELYELCTDFKNNNCKTEKLDDNTDLMNLINYVEGNLIQGKATSFVYKHSPWKYQQATINQLKYAKHCKTKWDVHKYFVWKSIMHQLGLFKKQS